MRRLLPALLLAGLALTAWPAASHAATRTINFDDFTAPCGFSATTGPLTDRYAASFGATFGGPSAGDGGTILNECANFGVTGHSSPNFLAFNTTANYPSSGTATGPETITFATPAHFVSIKAGQAGGGTITLRAFDGTTPVATSVSSTPAMAAVQTLEVAAARITSVQLSFTGNAIIFDNLTWDSAPVSGNDSFSTAFNTPLTVNAPGVLANDSDPDGDALTAALTRAPANGTVDLRADGSFTYTPRGGFSGADSIDYRANDATGNGNVATVTINVGAPPPPPPPPLPLLSSTVSNDWSPGRRFTKVRVLAVNDIPKGGRVVVQCKTKKKRQQRKACPKSKTFKTSKARRRLDVRKPLRKKKLPVGTKVTLTITAPGYVGKRFTYKIRAARIPSGKRVCILANGKPGKCRAELARREGALEQRREHDLRLRAGDARAVAQALERLFQVGGVAGADVHDRARLSRHRVGGLDLGVVLDRVAHLGGRHAPLRVERDERVRAPAVAAGVDLGRVAADHAVGLEPVDAPLDRRRAQRDLQPDALERAPRVLTEQRNDLPVDVVHTEVKLAPHATIPY